MIRALALLVAVGTLVAAAPAVAAKRVPKAIVLGIDGGTPDVLEKLDLPTLEGLAERGLYSRTTLYVPPLFLTVSGVGWGTMATGTWPDKHGLTTNSWPENDLQRYPSVLERLERTDARFDTAGFSVWKPMVDLATPGGPILGPSLDVRETAPDDAALGDRVGEWIRTAEVDAAFLQFDDVDAAGHSSGTEGTAYADQLHATDAALGKVLAGIRARPTFAREDWLVIVSSDHGHNPEGGHGGPTQRERTTYVIAAGGRVPRQGGGLRPGGSAPVERKLVDVAPSILDHLGVRTERRWGLDGRALWSKAVRDPFDRLAGRLTDGFTGAPPAGWETTGWRFATDPAWTQAFNDNPADGDAPNATNNPVSPKEIELDERENFLGGRGVRAFADAAAAGGDLDASLQSVPYDVRGARRAVLHFQEAYRGTVDQTAEVSVAFDGGEPRTVRTYEPTEERGGQPDTSSLFVFGFEELKGIGVPVPVAPEAIAAAGQGSSKVRQGPVDLDIAVPRGARTMRVTWRLRATGSGWFWTIDEPRVVFPGRVRIRGLRLRPRRGGEVAYRLSQAARVRIVVRRSGRRVAVLRRRGRAGLNVHRLRRPLAPGRYRLRITATDAAGNRSSSATTVVRRA